MSRSAQQSYSLESDARLSLEAAARMIQEHSAADARRRAVIPTPSLDNMGDSDEESSSREDRRHRRRRARRRREREEEEEVEEAEESKDEAFFNTTAAAAGNSNLIDATRAAALNQVLSAAANIADPVALSLSALRALTVRLNVAESSVESATSRAAAFESEAASIRATAALVTASLTERLGELESDMATLRARSAGANASAEHRIAEIEAENAALSAQLYDARAAAESVSSASASTTQHLLHTREDTNHATDEELVLLSDEIGRLQVALNLSKNEELRLTAASLEATTYSSSLRDDNNELRAALTAALTATPPQHQQQQPTVPDSSALLLAERDHELARALDSLHKLNVRVEIAERESKRARADAEASDMEATVAKNRATSAETALERASKLLDAANISLADVRERAIATASSDAAALSASRATEQWFRDALNTADTTILSLKAEMNSVSIRQQLPPPPLPPLPYRQLINTTNNDDTSANIGRGGVTAAGRAIVQRSSSLDLFAVPGGGGGEGGGYAHTESRDWSTESHSNVGSPPRVLKPVQPIPRAPPAPLSMPVADPLPPGASERARRMALLADIDAQVTGSGGTTTNTTTGSSNVSSSGAAIAARIREASAPYATFATEDDDISRAIAVKERELLEANLRKSVLIGENQKMTALGAPKTLRDRQRALALTADVEAVEKTIDGLRGWLRKNAVG